MTPEFALLTFATIKPYINEQRPPYVTEGQLGFGQHNWVLNTLSRKSDCWARADVGTFVFKIREGYGLLHAIQQQLLEKKMAFTLVYFDKDLFGNFPPPNIELLGSLGVEVHPIGL